MSSPPPLPNPGIPLKRPSISSTTSQGGGSNPNKRPRMHPLRQTSFPSSSADTDTNHHRTFSTASDAGSVSGSVTGSLGGASAATGEGVFASAKLKSKRGRKSKADKDRERDVDAASARGGTIDADGSSVRGGGGGGVGGDDADEDEDLEDEGELLGDEDEGLIDTDAEKKNLAILIDAFNPIQSERYDLFKRAKLKKETLRRIVNHALSQSVPASVVTTINGFTKVFAGEIIEKARTVQAEWAEAFDQAARAAWEAEVAEEEAREAAARAAAEEAARASAPSSSSEQTQAQTPQQQQQQQQAQAQSQQQPAATAAETTATSTPTTGENGVVKQEPPEGNGTPVTPSIPPHIPPAASTSMSSAADSQSQSQTTTTTAQYSPSNPPASQPSTVDTSFSQEQPARPKREFKPPPNPHRGQLLPSHLREAWRRYKRDQEGGGVGTSGLSLGNQGVKGAFTWSIGSTGRRLFR